MDHVCIFCGFSEYVSLALSSPRHYINKNVTVGAPMLSLTNSNEQFQIQYFTLIVMFLNPIVTRDYLKYHMTCF